MIQEREGERKNKRRWKSAEIVWTAVPPDDRRVEKARERERRERKEGKCWIGLERYCWTMMLDHHHVLLDEQEDGLTYMSASLGFV